MPETTGTASKKESEKAERRRITLYLLVGGLVLLLLPLLGIAYIKLTEAPAAAPSGAPIFLKHGQEAAPAPMPATSRPAQKSAAAPPAGGSMAYIRGGSDYLPPPEPKDAPPAPEKAKREPAAARPAKAAPAAIPRLKPTSGFTNFSNRPQKGAQGQGAGTSPAGMPDMSELMKNMPGGGSGQGMPDIKELMKGMPAQGDQQGSGAP